MKLLKQLYAVPETRIQEPTSEITGNGPDETSFFLFTPCLLGGPISKALDQAGAETRLSMLAECPLLDWTPGNSDLCAAWLNGAVRVSDSQLKRRWLFVVDVRSPPHSMCIHPRPKTRYSGSYLD